MQIHQKVVYQIFDLTVVMLAQKVSEGNAVLSTQRMIGYKSAQALIGKILYTMYIQLDVQILHTGLKKIHSRLVGRTFQESVDFFLMDDTLQVRDDKTWNMLRLIPRLLLQNFVYIY